MNPQSQRCKANELTTKPPCPLWASLSQFFNLVLFLVFLKGQYFCSFENVATVKDMVAEQSIAMLNLNLYFHPITMIIEISRSQIKMISTQIVLFKSNDTKKTIPFFCLYIYSPTVLLPFLSSHWLSFLNHVSRLFLPVCILTTD